MVRINSEASYERDSMYKGVIKPADKSVFSVTVIISRKASFFVTNNLLIVFLIDKYQVLNIIYLTMICCWFAIIKALNFEDESLRKQIDEMLLYCFVGLLFSLNVFILFLLISSYIKIRKLETEEIEYDRMIKNLPYEVKLYNY